LERLGVPAHEALHCGDDPRRDVEGAQGAGVLPVLMDREGRYPDAAPRVDSLAGLRDLL
jgi:putative hydrolase of the HAD superfamily